MEYDYAMPINCIAKAKVVSFPPVANGLSSASKVLWGRSVAQSGAYYGNTGCGVKSSPYDTYMALYPFSAIARLVQ